MTQEVLKLSQEALAGLKDVEKQVRELVAENKALKEALAKEKTLQALHDENERLGLYKDAYAQPEQDSTCSLTLRLQGKPYPRTCKKCGLGPCIAQPTAQPEQEPVAWEQFYPDIGKPQIEFAPVKIVAYNCTCGRTMNFESEHGVVAPQRTWVGLSEDDKVLINHDANFNQFMTAGEYADRVQQLTEARLKDKNT